MYYGIPSNLKVLFWDCDLRLIGTRKHKLFVISRILEKGDIHAIKWLVNRYGISEVINICLKSSQVSPKTKHFWGLFIQHNAVTL
jgi:hypothetical protein